MTGAERPHSAAARRAAAPVGLAALLAALLAVAAGGCSEHFAEGRALEAQGRWEQAAIAYRQAVIDDPDDPEYREALERARKVVARDNFERYKTFLGRKEFRKAFDRLVDATRQDAAFEAAQAEMDKWQRVLVGGQVQFDFDVAQSNISLADEIALVVRINTPNPGETIDAEVDLDTGLFFAEDLLYERPDELLTFYSIHAIGVRLVYGRSRIKKFTSQEFRRFINIRAPILDDVSGTLRLAQDGAARPVQAHRGEIGGQPWPAEAYLPQSGPHYSLRIERQRVVVSGAGGRTDFVPRFLYVNKADRRMFVDFGRYQVRLVPGSRRWALRRLPLGEADYFPLFARNIALQPYFFYREGVFTYVPAGSG